MGFGGTERQVLDVLRHLNRQRFDPALYLIYNRGELLQQVPADVPMFSYWERHRSPRLRFPGQILLSQIRDLSQTIVREQIDVVYDRASHMAITAGLATPTNVARVSVVVADPERDFTNSHRRFHTIKRALLRRAYSRADRVLAVSNGVREGLIRFHKLPPQQVVTCSNIFDFVKIRELANAPGPEFADDRFHIVCVGRLQREKGQEVLLRAIDQLVRGRSRNEILLWFIGSGPDEQALRQYVSDRGLQPFVRFEGYQPNPLPYVRQATLFCLPSFFEGMPNALIEAMACGTPVIASDCPSGPREILADGQFGQLVPTGNPLALADALEDAILDLSCDSNTWRRRAEAGRRHVEEAYSVAAGMERLESLLAEVAAAKRR